MTSKLAYGWIKVAAQRLSDQRQVAGWRPATLEAASFSSRAMRVLCSLCRIETALREKRPCRIPSAEVLGYLIVWLHELDARELADVATTPAPEDDGWPKQHPTPFEIRNHVLSAWELWSEDKAKHAAVRIGAAIVVALELCAGMGAEAEIVLLDVDLGKRKPHGRRHPDTW